MSYLVLNNSNCTSDSEMEKDDIPDWDIIDKPVSYQVCDIIPLAHAIELVGEQNSSSQLHMNDDWDWDWDWDADMDMDMDADMDMDMDADMDVEDWKDWEVIKMKNSTVVKTSLSIETTAENWEIIDAIPIMVSESESESVQKNTALYFIKSVIFYGMCVFLFVISSVNTFITLLKVYKFALEISLFWNTIFLLFSICIFILVLQEITNSIKKHIMILCEKVANSCSPINIIRRTFSSFSF
jgi:hypothetical protein